MRTFAQPALTMSLTAALLVGCGARGDVQPSIAMPQTTGVMPARATAHHAEKTSSSFCHDLYAFTGNPDGSEPAASIINVDGTLYGTTEYGGAYGKGTVFSVGATGEERVLHSFGSGSDGQYPLGGLIEVGGRLYGTTYWGGTYNAPFGGTAFTISKGGKEHIVHSFASGSDGANPSAGLIDVNGTLYGTTVYGGTYGNGTVFSINAGGMEQVLHSFGGGSDGTQPAASLIDVNGTLYGTTAGGGASGEQNGTVFSINTDGTEHVLHSFGGHPDGQRPISNLINVKGTLYGTTTGGGKHGMGTVFRVSTAGTEHVIHSFGHGRHHKGGTSSPSTPEAGLTAVGNALYGTTFYGGTSDEGTVFSINRFSGVVHVTCNFSYDGYSSAKPTASLIDVNGKLYGTASGRPYSSGAVFVLTP